jgi:gluconolactonase
MKRTGFLFGALFVAATVAATTGEEKKAVSTVGKIERLKPAFDKLIPQGAVLERLSTGSNGVKYSWTEGPVWDKNRGYLLYSDIPHNRVVKWQEGKEASDYLKPSGYNGDRTDLAEPGSNGLLIDSEGRLVLMQHGNRQVARQEKDGKITSLASMYQGKRLNSPNDGDFKSNGDLYFTDPPYGLMTKKDLDRSFPGQELDFCGVYRLSKDGKLTLLTKEMTKPNGIAFSPDEKTLYVANSDPARAVWMAFPVNEDGTLGKGKLFFDATDLVKAGKPGLPDGMKVDKDGNLFATGPGGVLVFAPDGTHLGTLATGLPTGNCCWGSDGTVLYVCAGRDPSSPYRIKTSTKGKGF